MSRLVVFVVALVAIAKAQDAEPTCAITGSAPAMPRALSFCYQFNDNACCIPPMDLENMEMFETMFDVGLSCRIRGDIRNHPMAKFYCLNCDPNQPKYVRNEPYVPTAAENEDTPWTLSSICPNENCTDGFDFGASTDSPIPTEPRTQTILICRDWAEKAFRKSEDQSKNDTETQFSALDECGLMLSSPCQDISGGFIPGRDRYMCGDDMIIPSANYYSVEQFLNADSMGPPAVDEEYGFKIVTNRQCVESDFAYAGDITSGNPSSGPPRYNRYNPDCLRTADQIRRYGQSAYANNTNGPAEFIYDEMCFNGSSAALFYPSVLLLVVASIFSLLL